MTLPALFAPGIEFDAEAHRYTFQGREVPSVTQILSGAGMMREVPQAARKAYRKGARKGTLAHALMAVWDDRDEDERAHEDIELTTLSEPDAGIVTQALAHLAAWQRWVRERNAKPVSVEQVVHSATGNYAGTLDRLIEINGQLVLVDIKTGPPQPWHRLQLAAYWYALREMSGPLATDIVRCYTLNTNAGGTCKIENEFGRADALRHAQDFLAVRRAYGIRKEFGLTI